MKETTKTSPVDAEEYTQFIIEKLKDNDIKAYLYCKAKTGSFYVKMENEKLGSIRIGDHTGRAKYKYKYNIRFDIQSSYEEMDRGTKRFYCPPRHYKKIISKIKKEMKIHV